MNELTTEQHLRMMALQTASDDCRGMGITNSATVLEQAEEYFRFLRGE